MSRLLFLTVSSERLIYSGRLPLCLPRTIEITCLMVTPAGFEPAIFWMRTKYPGPLDEGAVSPSLNVRLKSTNK